MALDFNTEPYYDNYDESKKFYRILFKPGYAVQARELTQLQTGLQDQIKKFGKHVFTEGSIVLGGDRSFEKDLLSIKLDSTYNSVNIDITKFKDVTITGTTSGTQAYVKYYESSTGTNPHTLVVKITTGTEFTAGENITCTVNSITYNATIQSTNPFNNAMLFSIESGIFFVKGCFAYVEPQTVAVDLYSNTSSKNIGLVANEIVITSDTDPTLLDNAQGTFNYAAPGADRYSIDLILTSKDIATQNDNFVEIARVVNGELVSNVTKTVYSEIGKELARRTYDESGNYTVKSWAASTEDKIVKAGSFEVGKRYKIVTVGTTTFTSIGASSNTVGVIFTATGTGSSSTTGTAESIDEFSLNLEPGKAYVKGYEFETINQEHITIDRARDVGTIDSPSANLGFGSYVYVSSVSGSFTSNALSSPYLSVSLKNSATTTIGTARVRYIKYYTGTPGVSTCVYKLYLFNIVMGSNNFKDVVTISNGTATASVNALSIENGKTILSEANSPELVYPLANTYMKTIGDGNYFTQMTFSGASTYYNGTFSSGIAEITLGANQQWPITSSAYSADDIKSHIMVIKSDGTVVNPSSVTVTGTINTNHKITITVSGYNSTATIIATIKLNNQVSTTRSKTLNYSKITLGTGSAGGLNTTANGKDSLNVADIYEIVGIYDTSTTNPSAVTVDSGTGEIVWNGVTHTDVTSNYSLDNGQRAEFYDHGNLILTGSAPASNHYLVAVVRVFTQAGSGYFTAESYTSTGLDYNDYPTFTDPASGKSYNLKDCIDFRPIRTAGAGSTTFSGGQIPDPTDASGLTMDSYSYYLGRMDKVIAMPDKTFQVIKGIPDVLPSVPTDNADGMTIYALVVPPYTGNVSDVAIKYVDNRRYTMRDIGKLDKRIQNLEYYTQLSLLEKQAKDTSIPDSSNFEKFKNGFAVDPFTSADIFAANANNWSQRKWSWWTNWFNGSNNWNAYGAMNYNTNSIAEATHTDFNAAIDPLNQELRAPFTVSFQEFNDPTLSNTIKPGELVTLGYTETSVISQLAATQTINVNPFNIIMFNGKLVLEPSFDQWVDTQFLPAVTSIVEVRVPDAADKTIVNGRGGGKIWATESTSTVVNTKVLGESVTSLGADVVDVQFVPYIRSKTIAGIASGLKPLATVLPFIENEGVSQYCRPLTLVTVQNHTGSLFDTTTGAHESLTFTGGATGKAAYYSSPTLTDSTKRRLAVMETTGTIAVGQTVTGANGGTATVTAVQTYSLGAALTPDEYGFLAFEVQIPAGTFKTGERTIRLIDDPTNDILHSSSTAEAKYTANGIIQTKQENILTTRTIQREKVTTITGYWYDPLAQTFNIDPRAYPKGMYISSVDVYFKTKSTSVPVKMQIRRTVNGYPESWSAIPFAEVELMPEHVNVSTDASVPTTFTFANPIYVSPADYAITLISQCQDYEVFIAEMGRTEVNGTKIVDKQPYNGSLFKSQNAATWTPVENQDLKFNIKRAVFNTSGTATFEIKDPGTVLDYQTLFVNSSSITPTGTYVDWELAAYESGQTSNNSFTPININQDIDFGVIKRLQDKVGYASLILRATLSTESDTVSPAVDSSALSVVAVKNEINNDTTGETNPIGGNAIAKYITKPINLASGFDANNINVTIDVNKLPGTDVKVYYKILPSEKTTPIIDEAWNLMVLENPVPSSANALDYKEHRYFPAGAFTNGIYTPGNLPIATKFNTLQIKIVLLSTSVVNTPKVRDLRIIALDS